MIMYHFWSVSCGSWCEVEKLISSRKEGGNNGWEYGKKALIHVDTSGAWRRSPSTQKRRALLQSTSSLLCSAPPITIPSFYTFYSFFLLLFAVLLDRRAAFFPRKAERNSLHAKDASPGRYVNPLGWRTRRGNKRDSPDHVEGKPSKYVVLSSNFERQ